MTDGLVKVKEVLNRFFSRLKEERLAAEITLLFFMEILFHKLTLPLDCAVI